MARRSRLSTSIAVGTCLMLVGGLSPSSALAAPLLQARVVQAGLVNPWDIAFAPGGQMIVTERPGRVRVYADGGPGAALLATSTVDGVRAEGEAGLMGIAIDPNFSTNRRIYVCASRQYSGSWLNQVLRYRLNGSWKLENRLILVKFGMQASKVHNGCAVEVGPDGKLWVSMGDGGVASRAQDPTSRNGKILRMNRDGSVPSDNPILPGAGKRTIIYSIGHRNSQGIAFHPGTGRVYAVEHGPDRADEINSIRPGKNYGWPCVTGFGDPYQSCSGSGPFTNPAWATGNFSIATSGGTFLKGDHWQGFRRHLFVAQLKHQDLRRFTVSSSGTTITYRATYYNERWGRLRAAVLGNNNNLWLTTSNGVNDKVIRIVPRPG
jgi:glucose/arabinose dehydrogenase